MSSSDIQIRSFDMKDKAQIHAIVKPLVSVAFNWSEENLERELDQAKTMVLEKEGRVIAFICLRDLLQAYDLTMVATDLGFQRQGYMELLMSAVIGKYAVDRQLWLEVHQSNKSAQSFYKKMGFEHSGTRGGYYSDGSAALLYTFRNPLLY